MTLGEIAITNSRRIQNLEKRSKFFGGGMFDFEGSASAAVECIKLGLENLRLMLKAIAGRNEFATFNLRRIRDLSLRDTEIYALRT